MKRKLSFISMLRIVIQLLFFFALPGLVAETFQGFAVIIQAVIRGELDSFFWQQILATVLVVLGTFFLGRFFCWWICAFGTLGDFFHLIGTKVFKIRVKMNERLDGGLKFVKYLVLIFIAGAIWIGGLSWFSTWSPWDAFGTLNSFPPDIIYTFTVFPIGVILFVIFMIGSMFIERFFCKYFCPLGAGLSIFSLLRIGRVKKSKKECGKCKICTNNCAMGIVLYRNNIVRSGECIDCMKCISPCPKKNVTFSVVSQDVTPLVASVAAVTMMGLYYGGNIYAKAFSKPDSFVINSAETTEKLVTIQPQLKSKSETSEKPTSTQSQLESTPETSENPTSVQSQLESTSETSENPTSVQSQLESTPETSESPTSVPSQLESTPETSEQPTETLTPTLSGYIDGTYQGSGTGYRRRTTTVSVTIESGQITDINTISTGDDSPYYDRAFSSVVSQIVDTQSTSVDAVSGATFSSDGIMSAVAAALSNAKS